MITSIYSDFRRENTKEKSTSLLFYFNYKNKNTKNISEKFR